MTRSQQTGTQTLVLCTGGMSHPCKSNCSGLYTEKLFVGARLEHWISFWYFVFSAVIAEFYGALLIAFRPRKVYHAAKFQGPPSGVLELAMYVRILSAFLVMLVLVCFLLLPSAAYAMESGLTLGWDGQDNVGARTTRPASASTLINLNDDNPRMNVAADARRASDAETTAPAVAPAVLAPHAQKEIGKALEALRANKLHEARSHLDAAYRLAPSSADVNYIFGVYWSQANNLDQAESYWTKTLEINPKHLNALLSLGDLLLRERKTDEALPLLKRATEVEPSSWRSHALLCHALLMQGSLDEAIKQAERALELGHGPATIIEPLLATALAGRGDTKRAISVLQGFLKEHPADATAKEQLWGLQTSLVAVAKKQDVVTANQTGRQDIANVVPEIEVEYLQSSRLPVGSGPTPT